MRSPTLDIGQNGSLVEAYYRKWCEDPESVNEDWRLFFQGFEIGMGRPAGGDAAQTGVVRLIFAYRDIGHFLAHADPLTEPPAEHELLELERFGLSEADLDRPFDTSAFFDLPAEATLREVIAALRETYCGTVGVEFLHIQDANLRNWLRERMEPSRNRPDFPAERRRRTLEKLGNAKQFELFLQTRYLGTKRFSLEGAETLIPVLDSLIERGPAEGVSEYIIGMAHRGRLNVLANILQKPYEEIFAEFEDNFQPGTFNGDGDVKYHLGFSSNVKTSRGEKVHLSLSPNPSHLEAVNPVVEGRVRAKQRHFGDEERRSRGVPVLIHGDAAFAGQGIVAETLNLSALKGYRTGGTVHIVVNNQIGFTTSPYDARSSTYSTDIAKLIQAPVFHVNAEDPDAAVMVTELALAFRQRFERDVVIDLVCYRLHGHNETDEPRFTHPVMYRRIESRPPIPEVYARRLADEGVITDDEAKHGVEEFKSRLSQAQTESQEQPQPRQSLAAFKGAWVGMTTEYSHEPAETAASREAIEAVVRGHGRVPDGFRINPKLAKMFDRRAAAFEHGEPIDWAFAEALAFGTLVLGGTPVRMSGQDSGRGTFSQRHAVLVDAEAEPQKRHIPLKHLSDDQASFDIYDSLLSEAAVLGFEFGYSLDSPEALVLWEAQFGDFANGAQSIIDQFIVCSESKWHRSSGIVLLLPHGYEGQGPEHSSARLERFLQSCAEDNIQVVNLTTPAQYFHVLRRQVLRNFRKPLVVMTPKSLLRKKEAVSDWAEFTDGRFRGVIDDSSITEPKKVRRVLLCSGKVYYDLTARRGERPDDLAIVRVEQFYPFPLEQLRAALGRYTKLSELIWVQEESQNMGGWTFMDGWLRHMGYNPWYVGRDASASPATGSLSVHNREQNELVTMALIAKHSHKVAATPDKDRVKQPSANGKPHEAVTTEAK